MSDEQTWATPGDGGWGSGRQSFPEAPAGQPPFPPQPPYDTSPFDGQPPFGGQPPYQGQPYAGQPYAGQPYPGQPFQGQPPFGQPPHGQAPYGQQQKTNRTVVIVVSIVGGLLLVFALAAVAIVSVVRSTFEEVDFPPLDGSGFEAPAADIPDGPRLLDRTGEVTGSSTATFDFVVSTSGPVQIDVIGNDGFDPVLVLRDRDGTLIGEDDDGGEFLDSQLVEDLTEGAYQIEVQAYSDTGGAFQVIVTAP